MMKRKINYVFLIALLFSFSGCVVYKDPPSVVVNDNETAEELKEVEKIFNSIESQEDKLLIHKMFSGAAEYLVNCETMQITAAFDPILGKVQNSYGWDRERYPELTDAVSDYLVSVGYQEPKKLESSKDRKDFAKIFQDLAEATKYE